MDKKIIKFDDNEFHQHESPFLINNIDINKIVASNYQD